MQAKDRDGGDDDMNQLGHVELVKFACPSVSHMCQALTLDFFLTRFFPVSGDVPVGHMSHMGTLGKIACLCFIGCQCQRTGSVYWDRLTCTVYGE